MNTIHKIIKCIFFVVIIFCFNLLQLKSQQSGLKINESYYIEIGGMEQWISLQGYSNEKPVLLFLHGGPGSPEMPLIKKYYPHLETKFIVCYWHQRGAGLSFSRKIKPETMNMDQFVNDAYELTLHLINKFNTEKIYIMGHSWGALLGLKLVFKYPDLYSAYFGIGQVIHQYVGEKISYNWVLNKSVEDENQKAIKELKKIGEPPYGNDVKSWTKALKTQRKWVKYYGGAVYGKQSAKQYYRDYLESDYIKKRHLWKYYKGVKFSIKHLWMEELNTNLFNEINVYKIPLYIFQGKYDYQVPHELVKNYFEEINAPKVSVFTFYKSAHNPIFEQTWQFNKYLDDILNSGKNN